MLGLAIGAAPVGGQQEVAASPTRSRIASPSPPPSIGRRLRLPDAGIEPRIIRTVGHAPVCLGGPALVLFTDRFLDGGTDERRPTPGPARGNPFEFLEGVVIDLDQ